MAVLTPEERKRLRQLEKNRRRRERYKEEAEFRARIITQNQAWEAKHPEWKRERIARINKERRENFYYTARRHGLTQDEVAAMHAQQKGKCAICGGMETRRDNKGDIARLAVDHNHETGQIRGLLCHRCNHSLGGFQDSPAVIRKAASYLEAFLPYDFEGHA